MASALHTLPSGYSSSTSSCSGPSIASGFTLVEVLVIAPIVILLITTFIGVMVGMVGDALVSRDQSTMAYEVQDGLDRIEQDVRISTQFLVTSNTLPSPQGSDNNFKGTATFTSSGSLILGALATDKNPASPQRQLVFYAKQPNACGSLQTFNRPFVTKVIYFIKNGSLWRRSIVPQYNTNTTPDDYTVCAAPWQQNSCADGLAAGGVCQTNDSELVKNVATFSIKYYPTPTSTTDLGPSGALSASTISVTIEGQRTTAGRTVTTSGSVTATKLNSIDADLPLPTTPVLSSQLTGPAAATFSWSPVPSATSYVVSYNVNGGAWINAPGPVTDTSWTIKAYRNDTGTIRVAARNATGTSPDAQAARALPSWTACALQSGWQNYGDVYPDARFTKTTANVVVLDGLVRSGSTTLGNVICTLPPEYRPDYRLIFQVSTDGTTVGRVDITPNGDVIYMTGSSAWLNLSTIAFIPSGAYTWSSGLTGVNGWGYYGDVYSPVKVTKDSLGRTHVEGLAAGGSTTNAQNAFALPGGYAVNATDIYPASSQRFNAMQLNPNSYIQTRGVPFNAFWSLQSMWWPTAGGWSSATLQNGWVRYSTDFAPAQYRKGADSIVSLSGLVKNGNTANGIPILTLPSGYRPKQNVICDAVTANPAEASGYARIDVTASGQVIVREGVKVEWLSLAGCDFIAEQ